MEVDIAVDLTGFTGNGRPGILAPAPSARPGELFSASPAQLGADFLDYIICDPTVIPETQQAAYSEKLAQLPDSFLPHDSKRMIASRNALTR